MRNLLYIFLAVILFSCKQSEQHRIACLTDEWMGKTVYYPVDSVFESFEADSVRAYSLKRTDYTIVTYVDSTTCSQGDLLLDEWKRILCSLQLFPHGKATCLFFFHPEESERDEIIHQLRRSCFNYPVCIDEEDIFNKLNHFPTDSSFQTFLVDRENKILALGNPAKDSKVRELYLKIISEEL